MSLNLEQILLLCFAVIIFIQLLYYWGVFSRLAFYKKPNDDSSVEEGVSVIICARDEYCNLREYLPLVLEQEYSDFEVVVVNDNSTDETAELLEGLNVKYKHLKVITLDQDLNFFKGKKFPLSIGIKSAKNELLLLTDADCKPAGAQWIKRMVANFDANTDVVLGYGGYFKKKGVLNQIIRFDTFSIALQYLSYSLMGKTYMGVGRNLAYRKSVFFKNHGFISHYAIPSGDDDLFINEVTNAKNTKIEIHPEAFTYSEPKVRFSRWFMQKQRHLSTAVYYKPIHKFLLGTYSLTQWLSYVFLFLLLIFKVCPWIVLGIFALRLISQLLIHYFSMPKLDEKSLTFLSPLLEFFFVIFNPILGLVNLFYKKNKW